MTGNRRAFDPDELRGGEGPELIDGELGQAWAMGRELEALRGADHPHPATGGVPGAGSGPARTAGGADPAFVAGVMAAVEREPSPRPLAAGSRAVRRLSASGVLVSLRDAWRVAVGPGRTFATRAGAIAYVLAAFVILGSVTGVAVVGTAVLLAPSPSQLPAPSAPAVSPDGSAVPPPSSGPGPSTEPGATTGPGPSSAPGPSGEPGQSDDPDESASPDDTPKPGATASPSATASPRASASPASSPDQTRTPRPSETARPTSSGGGDD